MDGTGCVVNPIPKHPEPNIARRGRPLGIHPRIHIDASSKYPAMHQRGYTRT